jgi:hypothetical protein
VDGAVPAVFHSWGVEVHEDADGLAGRDEIAHDLVAMHGEKLLHGLDLHRNLPRHEEIDLPRPVDS